MKRNYLMPEVKIANIFPQENIAWSQGMGVQVSGTTTKKPAAKMATDTEDYESFEEAEY